MINCVQITAFLKDKLSELQKSHYKRGLLIGKTMFIIEWWEKEWDLPLIARLMPEQSGGRVRVGGYCH